MIIFKRPHQPAPNYLYDLFKLYLLTFKNKSNQIRSQRCPSHADPNNWIVHFSDSSHQSSSTSFCMIWDRVGHFYNFCQVRENTVKKIPYFWELFLGGNLMIWKLYTWPFSLKNKNNANYTLQKTLLKLENISITFTYVSHIAFCVNKGSKQISMKFHENSSITQLKTISCQRHFTSPWKSVAWLFTMRYSTVTDPFCIFIITWRTDNFQIIRHQTFSCFSTLQGKNKC